MRISANFALTLALSAALASGASAMTNPWADTDWEYQETKDCLADTDFWSDADWEAKEKKMGSLCEWSGGKPAGKQAGKPGQPAQKPAAQAAAPAAGADKWNGARTFQEKEGGITVQGRLAQSSDKNAPMHMQLRAPSGPNAEAAMKAASTKAMKRACGPTAKNANTLSNKVVSNTGGTITRELSFKCVF